MAFWLPLAMAAAGALAGKAKNDRAQEIERADRKLASETQRYSPWTGMQANNIRQAGSQFGDMFSGGVGGAMMGQSLSSGMAGMGGETQMSPMDKLAQEQGMQPAQQATRFGRGPSYTA